MQTKWKLYLPLIIFIPCLAAASAFAINSVIPDRNTSQSLVNKTVAGGTVSDSHSLHNPARFEYPRYSNDIDPVELNRRLIAEGLEPVIVIPEQEPVKPTPTYNPPPPPHEPQIEPPPVHEPPAEPYMPPTETEPSPSHPIEPASPEETIASDTTPDLLINASHDRNPEPAYPKAAERKGMEGTVTLRVKVGTDGYPLSIEIATSSGHAILDKAAVNAVRDTWRFNPATLNGCAVESWVEIPIVFTLG